MFAKLIVGLFGIICGIIGTVYWILVAAWLYKSAANVSMTGILWGFFGLLIARDIAQSARGVNHNA